MCLLAFYWKSHSKYKLIFVSNRDEFYERQTAKAHFWEDTSHIVAGRDLEAGGTWMGISKNGRFTALTNYRDPKNILQNVPSRGDLTANFLKSQENPQAYLEKLIATGQAYNGYNLLVGDTEDLYYFSNYENKVRNLEAGFYGLSNHLLETPWFKVKSLKEGLAGLIEKEQLIPENIFEILQDPTPASDEQVQQTGMSFEMEKMLSAKFITSPKYGTRASYVVLIDYDNQVTFSEQVYIPHSERVEKQEIKFKIS